jgi:serine/threonine protein kinase
VSITIACSECGSPVYPEDRFCGSCGTPHSPSLSDTGASALSRERAGKLLAELRALTAGEYEIRGEIGRGGMAVVYLAKQPVLGRSVALKELAPFLAGDPALASRFIREARVAGSLNHANVVTVFDFLEQDGVPYIAMEYLERGSLRPYVGRMSLAQIAGVLEGLLAALSHAEATRIVHRDVKPENLLITGEGGIKIADFGIAKAVQQVATEEMLTPAGATVGTPAYMAPEQAMAQEIGPWTDLYQTGVVAFELLTGQVPFQSEGAPIAVLMKHISDPVPDLPAGTNPALAAWVRRLMAKEPDQRPADARVAWNELEEIIVDAQGPLWRRDARLGDHEPTVEHPTPLTPARFSSWQDPIPDPTVPPPPPPPATSGYVDYVREPGPPQPTPPPPADPEPQVPPAAVPRPSTPEPLPDPPTGFHDEGPGGTSSPR